MQHVYILAIGNTAVGEHYTRSLNELVLEAFRHALAEVKHSLDPSRIGALYIANAMGDTLAVQSHLGAALATACGLQHVEAFRIEAAGASGGVALLQAARAVACGVHELVAVVGVEKVTDRLQDVQEASIALAIDSDFEAEQGITLTAQWAMLMRRYMHEYGYEANAFAPFPINAHANGTGNPDALYRFPVKLSTYQNASQIASPLNMLDCSTLADGAAVVLVASDSLVRELSGIHPIRIAGCAMAMDSLALHQRRNPLHLNAVQQSATSALRQAKLKPSDIDVLELCDPHGIAAALALEASGFVQHGTAPRHAAEGGISSEGTTPLATAGGYKARGDVGGASGIYQVVELVRQLRGTAPSAQVRGAKAAFAQSLGGIGATAVTHILVSEYEGAYT